MLRTYIGSAGHVFRVVAGLVGGCPVRSPPGMSACSIKG